MKVAALVMNNDFGKVYDATFKAYIAQSPHKDKIKYEYLDGKTQTLPSGVTVDVRRDTPAPSAQSRSAPPKPEGVLVRAPCPGRVVPASGPGVVREGETIGEIQCGRRRVDPLRARARRPVSAMHLTSAFHGRRPVCCTGRGPMEASFADRSQAPESLGRRLEFHFRRQPD